jgi:hypothetical protein
MGAVVEAVVVAIKKADCPKCNAKAGTPCHDPHGRGITHGERLHAPPANGEPEEKRRKAYHMNY